MPTASSTGILSMAVLINKPKTNLDVSLKDQTAEPYHLAELQNEKVVILQDLELWLQYEQGICKPHYSKFKATLKLSLNRC